MQELVDTTSELSAAITDILTALRDSTRIVVAEISTELAEFAKLVGFVVTYNIIDILDYMFELYSYEWVFINNRLTELDGWIDTMIYNKVGKINAIINNFTLLTDALIQISADQLSLIDIGVSPEYNERMFAIYGYIAGLSVAIDAPPSYLEESIQNARFFSMAIACSTGLPYYQFQSDWADGVERLLIRISNSIPLYKQNPQWIKVDIEEGLIKPIFEIEVDNRRKEKQQLIHLSNELENLQNLVFTHKTEIDENKQTIINLYELEILPALKEIVDSFDNWKQDIYATRTKFVDKSFVSLFIQIIEGVYEAQRILGLLDYGGDLLLRTDKLAANLRIVQEDKIADITTRSFRRLVPEWLAEVKKGID